MWELEGETRPRRHGTLSLLKEDRRCASSLACGEGSPCWRDEKSTVSFSGSPLSATRCQDDGKEACARPERGRRGRSGCGGTGRRLLAELYQQKSKGPGGHSVGQSEVRCL